MSKERIQPTLLFYDFETFGSNPALDRPAQFAGIRTDENLNIISEPEIFYCRLADDYLPQPEAVMVTGITPQQVRTNGVTEAQFTLKIHQLLSQPGTCVVGYNNIRFDDEVTRHLCYRNFFDPYGWSWKNGNSRWDLLDVMRACYALRPEGINWPSNDQGFPSFRLEHLTSANDIAHQNAHDATSDVYATIALAKMVKEKKPRLYDYLFTHRNKQKLTSLIDIPQMTPLLHVSGMFGAWRGNTSLIVPLAWHPDNKNAVIACDLAGSMSPLLELNACALRDRLYTRHSDLPEEAAPMPLKLVHINKCPVLAPANTLRPQDAARLGIDLRHCWENMALLQQHPAVREKVVTLFAETEPRPSCENVDAQLYQGFFSDADRNTMEIIQRTRPENLPALNLNFEDKRIEKLLFRYRARNFPATLDDSEQRRWMEYRREVLSADRLQQYFSELTLLTTQYDGNQVKLNQLRALANYAQELAS